jgi:hypothetical protein
VRQLGEPQKRASGVDHDIVCLLTEFFFVEVIRVPVYVPTSGEQAEVFEVIGTHANVEMAQHVFAFLHATAEKLWQENRGDARVRSGRDRRAYQSGVVRGFREKLVLSGYGPYARARPTSEESTALVWTGDSKLEEFFRARYPRIRRRRRSLSSSSAHAAGREAGRTVILNKPVTRGPTDGAPRLLRD